VVRAIATCVLLSAVFILIVPMDHASSPTVISYRADLATMTRTAPYQVFAPAGLPRSWSPVNSGVAVGGANGPGTVTWRLGFVTPSGTLAALEETNTAPAPFIRRMTNSGTAQPPVTIGGRTWAASVTSGRGQRSLAVTTAGGITLVVTGNASAAQLRTLAASLRPQPGHTTASS
jgi:Protein of unknown function (DUF4245)